MDKSKWWAFPFVVNSVFNILKREKVFQNRTCTLRLVKWLGLRHMKLKSNICSCSWQNRQRKEKDLGTANCRTYIENYIGRIYSSSVHIILGDIWYYLINRGRRLSEFPVLILIWEVVTKWSLLVICMFGLLDRIMLDRVYEYECNHITSQFVVKTVCYFPAQWLASAGWETKTMNDAKNTPGVRTDAI